jgi:CHAT domain-containing protein
VVDELTPSPIREGCPEPEAIAAYVDGRLAGAEKAEMEAHLASCDDCLAVFSETARSETELKGGQAPAAVVRGRFGRRWILLAVAASLVVAAGVPFVLRFQTRRRIRPELAELVAAVGPQRLFEPRLTGGFEFGPMAPRYRSAKPLSESDSWELLSAAAKIRQKDEKNSTPATLDALGAANLVLGKYDDAVSNLEEATLEEPKNARFLTDLSAAYLVRAKENDRAVDYPKAIEAAEKATELDPSILEAWFNRALALDELPLKSEAAKAWNDYLKRDPKSPWAQEARRRLSDIQAIPNHAAEWKKVKAQMLAAAKVGDERTIRVLMPDYCQETREWLEEELLPEWAEAEISKKSHAETLFQALGLVAVPYARWTGDDSYQSAVIALASPAGQIMGQDVALGIRKLREGRLAYEADSFDRGAPLLRDARTSFLREAPALGEISLLYLAACRHYQGAGEEALKDVRSLESPNVPAGVRGYGFWLDASIHLDQGDYGAALEKYRQAATRLQEVRENGAVASVRSLMAQTLHQLGDNAESWDNSRAALALADRVSDPDRFHTLYTSLALGALSQGFPSTALHLELSARDGEVPDTTPIVRAECRVLLARIHEKLGMRKRRHDDLADARLWLDRGGEGNLRRRMEADLLTARVETGDVQNPVLAINEVSRSLSYFEEAGQGYPLPHLLLVRGTLRRRLLQMDLAASDFEEGIREFEKQRLLLAGGRDISYFDRSWALFEQVISLKADAGDPVGALSYVERLHGRGMTDSEAPASVAEIRAALAPGERLLYFAYIPGQLFSWAVSRDQVRMFETAVSAETLAELVRRARRDCRSPSGNRQNRDVALAQLYELVVEPVGADLPREASLVLVPDATLATVPFAALLDARTGHFLIEDHEISLIPSGTFLVRRRQEVSAERPPVSVLAVAGNTRGTIGLASLPNAERESEEVARMYARGVLLAGAEATPSRFLASAQGFDVVHFAGHALTNPDHPSLSFLALAGGGWGSTAGYLFAREVEQRRFPATMLVVLSACSTAEGFVSPGEGALSLARPFLLAGVRRVVSSLWEVDDRESRDLMVQFHRELRYGRRPSAALRTVQTRALMKDKGRSESSSRGWAAYEVMGG